MSLVEVTDENWGPIVVGQRPIWPVDMDEWHPKVTDNQTSVAGVGVEMYLVESNMTNQIPGLARVSQHPVGATCN